MGLEDDAIAVAVGGFVADVVAHNPKEGETKQGLIPSVLSSLKR